MNYGRIKEVFDEYTDNRQLSGYSLARYKGGREVLRLFGGYADAKKTKEIDENSVFRMASMTKPITAVAVMIAVERGLLDLDAPIGKYIGFHHSGVGEIVDGNIVFESGAREITLRDILTHSSGLGSGKVGDRQVASANYDDLISAVKEMDGWYLDFAPATKCAYSAVSAFELAAAAVEKVTDTDYESFVEREIFAPLKMKDTCYTPTPELLSRAVKITKATGSGFTDRDLGDKGFDRFVRGSAGLFSTLGDYARFAAMLAGKGELFGKRILKESSVKEMSAPQRLVDDYFSWGLGGRVLLKQDGRQTLPVGTYGWSGAYGTHFYVEPSGDFTLLMVNMDGTGGSGSPFSKRLEEIISEVEQA